MLFLKKFLSTFKTIGIEHRTAVSAGLMLVSTFHYPSLAQYRLAWQNIDSLNRSLQVGRAICIRKFEGTLPSGKKIAAYLAVIKLKSKRLQIASVPAQEGRGLLLTSELSHLHQSLVAINGGYFTFRPDTAQQARSSVSLLVHQGKLISPHLLPVFRKDSAGNSCALYPTRSAVGFTGRRVRFAWTFTDSAGTTWAYDKPNPFTTQPLQQNPPTLFFPTTPYQWQASEIMGGGPMLIWKGTVFITDKEEWFTQIAGTHPRTAVGLDRKGRLLLLVVDGRQSGYSEGVTFSELAAIFLGLKANYAINLDGGGSSTMVVKGKVINRPSDKNGERKVASILAVIRK